MLFAVVCNLACDAIHEPLVVDPISVYCSVDQLPLVVSLSPVHVCVVPASMKIANTLTSPMLIVPDAPDVAAVPVAPAALSPPVRNSANDPPAAVTSVIVHVLATGDDPKLTVMVVLV